MSEIRRIADELWEHQVQTQPFYALRVGRPIDDLRAESLADAQQDQALALRWLQRLGAMPEAALLPADRLTRDFLSASLRRLAQSPSFWRTAFPFTPYNAYALAFTPQQVLGQLKIERASDVDRFVHLLTRYAVQIRAQTARLLTQAEAGWRIPRPALPGARATLSGIRGAVRGWLALGESRLGSLAAQDRTRLQAGVESILTNDVDPAFAAALDAIDADYEKRAPDRVGLAQFRGGLEAYALWIEGHMTEALVPERVHEIGHQEVERLTESMRELRSRTGFKGDESAFADKLRADGRLFARSAADVEARYLRCIERMRPLVGRYFHATPRAAYDVRRLDAASEAGMSYGYYESPTPAQPQGLYRYNGSGLETRSQLNAAALIYHELVPGHHFHLARQAENEALPQIRRHCIDLSVFNEGWAEYASGLAGEMGLYDDPVDAYGRLVHERFTAQRLVTDTGLNALGWDLARARDYMARYTLESPTQIATETLRYSTDLPGQALAYRMGYLRFMQLRERMKTLRGAAFDVRDFHEAVLGEGAMPFPVLERHVERVASRSS